MFWYGHPLITEGAGRIKTDPINEKRIEMVLSRFQNWANKNNISSLQYSVNSAQLAKSAIAFPLGGFALGLLGSYTFVHPNSRYIGKFFTLFTTTLGWVVHLHYRQTYNATRRFGNYPIYPHDIKRMIDNNDSRYAYRWLKDQYLEIPSQNISTEGLFQAATQQ